MNQDFLQAVYAASYNDTVQQIKQAVNQEALLAGGLGTSLGSVLGFVGANQLHDRNPTGNAALAGPAGSVLGGIVGGVAGSYIPGIPVIGAGLGSLLGSTATGLAANAIANRGNTSGPPTTGAARRIMDKVQHGMPLTPEEKKLRPVVEQLMWAQDKLTNGTDAEKRKANQIILSAAGVK